MKQYLQIPENTDFNPNVDFYCIIEEKNCHLCIRGNENGFYLDLEIEEQPIFYSKYIAPEVDLLFNKKFLPGKLYFLTDFLTIVYETEE